MTPRLFFLTWYVLHEWLQPVPEAAVLALCAGLLLWMNRAVLRRPLGPTFFRS